MQDGPRQAALRLHCAMTERFEHVWNQSEVHVEDRSTALRSNPPQQDG